MIQVGVSWRSIPQAVGLCTAQCLPPRSQLQSPPLTRFRLFRRLNWRGPVIRSPPLVPGEHLLVGPQPYEVVGPNPSQPLLQWTPCPTMGRGFRFSVISLDHDKSCTQMLRVKIADFYSRIPRARGLHRTLLEWNRASNSKASTYGQSPMRVGPPYVAVAERYSLMPQARAGSVVA